jgi:DNA-binding GntR family transcriptional regulator
VSSTTRPLTRASLRDQVHSVLRSQIITGELEADCLYSVGEFALMLGVSATPVREALSTLEQHGLVRVIRNRGFIVPPLTDHDLDEIFELRTLLEVPAVERCVSQLSADDVAGCRDAVDRCLDCATRRELAGFLDADQDFHLRLLRSAGNDRLVAIVERLRDQTRLYGLRSLTTEDLVDSATEHGALLEAIERRDVDQVRALLTRHLEHTRGLWAGDARRSGE